MAKKRSRNNPGSEELDPGRVNAWEDEGVVERLMKKAKSQGDIDSAWTLLHMLIETLDAGATSPALFKFAADFFADLVRIRSEKDPKEPTRAELSRAFDKLHILRRGSGRPKLDDLKIVERFATEETFRAAGMPVLDAREVLERRGIAVDTMRDLRTNHPDLVRLVEALCPKEREVLARNFLEKQQLGEEE
jgi:hypothetical protein